MLKKLILLPLVLTVSLVLANGCTKRNPAAPADAFVLTPTATPVTPNLLLIDDCETATVINKCGGAWYVFNDAGNGGTSQVVPNPFQMTLLTGQGAQGSNGYAGITGTVTTAFVFGFIGMGTALAPANGKVDLSQYQGVRFFVKGDGKTYSLKIQTSNITDYDYYQVIFSTTGAWEEKILPFTDAIFKQGGFGTPVSFLQAEQSATGFQWQTVGQPFSSVELEIDNIFLYK
jgi:hypothetical protein